MRLIDADALCEEFKERQRAALRWKEKAILDSDEERSIRADATLAFLSEVKLTIDNAPTVEAIPTDFYEKVMEKTVGELLECQSNLRPQGEWKKEDKPWGGFGDRVLVNTCPFCKESFVYHGNDPKFCSECGADMRGDQDD